MSYLPISIAARPTKLASMKKNFVLSLIFFSVGFAVAFLIFSVPEIEVETDNAAAFIERKIIYSPDGRIRTGQLTFPNYRSYYSAIAEESGYTISAEDVPDIPVSMTLTNMSWIEIIEFLVPGGFVATELDSKTYRIHRIHQEGPNTAPNQQRTEPTRSPRESLNPPPEAASSR